MSASRLAPWADLFQVIVSITVLAIALNTYLARKGASARDAPPRLAVGTQMSSLPGISYARRPITLVLFERSNCDYCTQSMPFYASLSGTIDRTQVQLVAASFENREISDLYLRRHNVITEFVVQLDGKRSYPIEGTPTLVMVDTLGKVRHSWVGLLDQFRQQEVRDAILRR